MDCYKVLGIAEDADQKEIKRAYFRLVRQFSPEQDPERFQEIRAAYEMLTSGDGGKTSGLLLEFPDCLLAKQMREACQERMDIHDYKGAIAAAEEALERFGETDGFLYFLAHSQLHAGNTGKAVKNFERLVSLHQDKLVFRRELAMAYQERGFGNKAYQAFQMAYDMGCRDTDFLMRFSMCCSDREMPEQGIKLLIELLADLGKNLKGHMEEALSACSGMLMMGIFASEAVFSSIMASIHDFLRSAVPYLDEYAEDMTMFAAVLLKCVYDRGYTPELKQNLEIIKMHIPEDSLQEEWKQLEELVEGNAIEEDDRLSELMRRGYEAFVIVPEEVEPWFARYAQLDTELCILEEWPGIRGQIEIVREDYPGFYEKIHDYIQILENTNNIGQLRERLQNEYDRRRKNMEEGFYYKEYPHRKRSKSTVRWDSDEGGTYVRSQPKIGRNDPCPCGSGKKYKNCCGKAK